MGSGQGLFKAFGWVRKTIGELSPGSRAKIAVAAPTLAIAPGVIVGSRKSHEDPQVAALKKQIEASGYSPDDAETIARQQVALHGQPQQGAEAAQMAQATAGEQTDPSLPEVTPAMLNQSLYDMDLSVQNAAGPAVGGEAYATQATSYAERVRAGSQIELDPSNDMSTAIAMGKNSKISV